MRLRKYLIRSYAISSSPQARAFGMYMNKARLYLIAEVARSIDIYDIAEMSAYFDMETPGLLYVDLRARETRETLSEATAGKM